MKASELRDKSEAELRQLSEELRKQLFDLRMQHFTGQLERVSDIRATRRDIARVETILNERNREQAQG